MSCEHCSDELRSVIRSQNRALRIVNRNLRRKVEGLEGHSDDLFFTLCETNPQAEEALREVWERINMKCSPDDYASIVEDILAVYDDAGYIVKPKDNPTP